MAQVVSGAAVTELRQSMTGDVITADHAAYDELRKVWNGDVDRRPAVIARCTSVDDVVAAVGFGRRSGLPIAVRAGGHSFPGHGVVDDGLVIDVRGLNSV